MLYQLLRHLIEGGEERRESFMRIRDRNQCQNARRRRWMTVPTVAATAPAERKTDPRRTENCLVLQFAALPQPQSIVSTGVIGSMAAMPRITKSAPKRKSIDDFIIETRKGDGRALSIRLRKFLSKQSLARKS